MAVNIKIQTVGDDKAVAAIDNITAAEKEQSKAFDKANESFKKSRSEMQKTNKEAFRMKEAFNQIKKAIITAAIFETFKRGIVEVGKTTAAFQKLEATLTVALGSRSKAQEALRQIREFAAVTPFQVDEIAQSFNKLANRIQGIKFDNNQFTALGDLSASLGKDLEQLVEAILDVNNTERWNELGIKVKTEGDKITGTFKGVTKTFEKSEEGALAMATAFGQMEGIAGGMALQAATLGGQYSNLIDNTERLKLVTGEQLNGVFSDAIALFNDLVTAAGDYLAVPLSEEIKNEQVELNTLVNALINTADEQGNLNNENVATSGLLDELNDKYPSFIDNLDTESLSVSILRDRLQEVNNEYIRKILLQQKEEELSDLAKKQVDLQKQLVDLEKARAKIQSTSNNASITPTSGGFGGQNIQASQNVGRANVLSDIEKQIISTQNSVEAAGEDFANAIAGQDELYKRFNITANEATENQTKNTKATTKNTASKKENNDVKAKALALQKALFALDRSELQFELEKNKIAQSQNDIPEQQIKLIAAETELRQALIEVKRKEALLSSKINEDKLLANQNSAQSLELLRLEIEERNKQIESEIQPLESKRIDIEELVQGEISDLKDLSLENAKSIIDQEREYRKQANEADIEEEQRKAEQRKAIARETAQVLISLVDLHFTNKQSKIDAEFDTLEINREKELKLVGDSEKGKASVEARFTKKSNALKRKQAEKDREKALFDVKINTATNAIKLFAQTVPPGILSAFAIAQGIIQTIAIKNQPLPKFFDGTEYLNLGNNPKGIDTIPILANEGERIVPTLINQQLKGISNAELPHLVALGQSFLQSGSNDNNIAEIIGQAVESALAKQPKYITEWDESGVQKYIVKGQNKAKNLNKTFQL